MYILCQSQTFCARQKDDLQSAYEEALNTVKFLNWLKKIRLAQNILEPVQEQDISILISLIFALNFVFVPRISDSLGI